MTVFQNRRARQLFSEFVDATADHDADLAIRLWQKTFTATAPWLEQSEIGERLILDAMN